MFDELKTREIKCLIFPEIEEVNDDRNRQCEQCPKKFRIDKFHASNLIKKRHEKVGVS
jgi:hypothetical protein